MLSYALERCGIDAGDRVYIDAAMAGVALVALADCDERLSELVARDEIIERLKQIKTFDVETAVMLYEKHARRLEQDRAAGEKQALASLARRAGGGEESRLLLRACLAIARADQEISEGERRTLLRIADVLEVPAGEIPGLEE